MALDIEKRKVKLSELRLRERRATLLVTLYTLAGWAVYVTLWYMRLLPNFSAHGSRSGFERTVKGLPVVVGPVIILFVRRIVQIWYKRKGDAEEKALQSLLKQQRNKLEEIKKKTNYYSMRDLVQRYDEPVSSSPGLRQRIVSAPTQPSTPQRPMPQPPNGRTQTPHHLGNPLIAVSPPSAPVPHAPPRKQWYDKLADALLGDDDHTPNASVSRYALICEKCFAHNGLVKESMWEDAQYICPKCNHFNPSVRAKKLRSASPSVSPSTTPSPSPKTTTLPRQPSPTASRGGSPPTVDKDTSLMEVDDS
ncbi:hypothetical protein BDZ94DRAFT_1258160 [Collybia nuda]|uniref:Endoplasmic reticulum junction formation protein lunapark n=1 Tax=Collybia nuda TaxID=64659 RepID=A0A9P5Y7J7_9AGAR|nr:hypothetical protein BDZ94DRAFT_1258160 [Collybia nuda]